MIGARFIASTALWAIACAAAASCGGTVGPRPQWLFTISSDAPIPQLADRLVVQIVDTDGTACAGCTRTFALTSPDALPLSFGIEPSGSGVQRVWATLYKAEQAGEDGRPVDAAHLEALGILPRVDGVTDVALTVPMSCFGIPADPVGGTTCDPATAMPVSAPVLGAEPPMATGSWAPAQPVDCGSAAPTGQVCVPGGVFLMGSRSAINLGGGLASYPEHLVQVSPFFLDVYEVTVGDVGQLLMSGKLASSMAPVVQVSDITQLAAGCTYLGANAHANDALPANCITYDQAGAICAALGRRLPSEAEWEYAARNTTEESTYPWGEAADVCSEAAIALGRGDEIAGTTVIEFDDCRGQGDASQLPWGARAIGTTATDVTELGIYDMGGNVGEWVEDAFQTYVDTCWSGGSPQLVEPNCNAPSAGFQNARALRGGAWTLQGIYAVSAMRAQLTATQWLPGYGVRCAQTP